MVTRSVMRPALRVGDTVKVRSGRMGTVLAIGSATAPPFARGRVLVGFGKAMPVWALASAVTIVAR